MESVFVIVLFVLVIILFTQHGELKRRFALLERLLISLQNDVARNSREESPDATHDVSPVVVSPDATHDVSPVVVSPEESHEESHEVPHVVVPYDVPPVSNEVPHEVPHEVSHEVPPVPPFLPPPRNFEAILGGKLLNRLGALATLIGLVFLF